MQDWKKLAPVFILAAAIAGVAGLDAFAPPEPVKATQMAGADFKPVAAYGETLTSLPAATSTSGDAGPKADFCLACFGFHFTPTGQPTISPGPGYRITP